MRKSRVRQQAESLAKRPIDLGWTFNTDDLQRHGFNSVEEYMAQRGYERADDTGDGDGIFAGLLSVAGGIGLLMLLL